MYLSKPWRRTTGLPSLCIKGFTQLLMILLSANPTCIVSGSYAAGMPWKFEASKSVTKL